MTIEISNATKQDLSRLIEMFSDPDLKTNLEESGWFINCYFDYHHILVAKIDGSIQGACVWRIEGERYSGLGWIENIWVESQFRRMGLAKKLMRRTVDDMKDFFQGHGFKLRNVVLTTQVGRAVARSLYEKMGFKAAARLDELYDPGGQDLVYVLEVRS